MGVPVLISHYCKLSISETLDPVLTESPRIIYTSKFYLDVSQSCCRHLLFEVRNLKRGLVIWSADPPSFLGISVFNFVCRIIQRSLAHSMLNKHLKKKFVRTGKKKSTFVCSDRLTSILFRFCSVRHRSKETDLFSSNRFCSLSYYVILVGMSIVDFKQWTSPSL